MISKTIVSDICNVCLRYLRQTLQISETIVLDIIENYNLYKLVSTICSAFARAILPVSVIGSLFMC